MTWSENFAGVISRTINSVPDELAERRRIVTPDVLSAGTQENLDYINDVVYSSESGLGHDSEYDVFSYAFFGLSGNFIIKNNQALLLNHSNDLKIELLSNNPLSFCISRQDGTKFYFGTNGNIESSKHDAVSLCNNSGIPGNNRTTAWFLTKVVSPVNETLNFYYGDLTYYYVSDFIETYTLKAQQEQGDDNDPCSSNYYSNNHSYCTRSKWTSTKYLTSVTGPNFNLGFTYRNRNDLVGDKILEKITLNNDQGQTVSQADFSYLELSHNTPLEAKIEQAIGTSARIPLNTRYFLSSVKIGNGQDPNKKTFKFSYKSPELLPNRFSFAQDLAGYFNGKGGAGFIPAAEVQKYITANPRIRLIKQDIRVSGRLWIVKFDYLSY
jgi:hypothetical protein